MRTPKIKNKKSKIILKCAVIVLLAVIVLPVCFVIAVRTVNYFSNHITAENGIDEGVYVELGGQEQYLLIRGKDVNNPVIIWVHGGPSSPDAFINYTFEKYLVEDYTVVCWDQRGCGRTYFKNQKNDPDNATAIFEQAIIDLDELVDYVNERFAPENIVIVGHSYGTLVGSKYALEHPDKISAYIGVGQFVNMESDIYSYEDALAKAKQNGDNTEEMENAYRLYCEDRTLLNMLSLRSYAAPYHAAPREANTMWLGICSPYMGVNDIRWFFKQLGNIEDYLQLNKQLFDYIMYADIRDYGLNYEIPVGFISGESDWTTPVAYSEAYYNDINAPLKSFYTIEGCGHSPHYDSPKEFCDILCHMLDEYLRYE